jgi:hypothetical protein
MTARDSLPAAEPQRLLSRITVGVEVAGQLSI